MRLIVDRSTSANVELKSLRYLVGQEKEDYLMHHGIKGQKWGVRNGPPYPLDVKNQADKKQEVQPYRETITGHGNPPPTSKPGAIIDKVDHGKVMIRFFYGKDGRKERDIHTTNHGKPKAHPYGSNGEHAHDYIWYQGENGKMYSNKTTREITQDERKENSDII